MKNDSWILIDVETSGLASPIYILEIFAQRMNGFSADGPSFHAYLNHGIEVPPEATAVNGITTEFLTANGMDPLATHSRLIEFIEDSYICAHNLAYDWGRALLPEWERLGIDHQAKKGFCSMLLARRTLFEQKSVSLDNLRKAYDIPPDRRHTASGDVLDIIKILQTHVQPRLQVAKLDSFEKVLKFSKMTPIKKCHAMVNPPTSPPLPPSEWPNEWYCVDSQESAHGPYPAAFINELANGQPCYVWNIQMKNWQVSVKVPAFEKHLKSPSKAPPRTYEEPKSMGELVGLCKGIAADDKITNKEVYVISDWLSDFEEVEKWPASEIFQVVEKCLSESRITRESKSELLKIVRTIVGLDCGFLN